jgi:hypothetical protein
MSPLTQIFKTRIFRIGSLKLSTELVPPIAVLSVDSRIINFMSGLSVRIVSGILFCFLLVTLSSSPLAAASRPRPTKSSAGGDYARALAAADHFLQAWQGGDIETGIVMLSGKAKNNTNRDDLDRMFASSAPAAYEIDRGRFLRHGRYEFPVVLLGTSPKKPQRRFSRIVVLNTSNNDWAIDKLP